MSAIAQPTPADVAERFFGALGAQQWRQAASMIDTASADAFRERELAILVALRNDRPVGGARSGGGSITAIETPTTLDSAALRNVANSPLSLFSDIRTIGALAALPPLDFAARYLEVSQRSMLAMHAPAGAAMPIDQRTYDVLGYVLEGDSLAHVLYRQTDADIMYEEPHAVSVLQMRRAESGWRLLVPTALSPLPYTLWLTKDD